MTKKSYSASSIQVLEDLEHVRKRPGMYIGSQDHDGVRQILKEVVDNVIDEHLEGHASVVSIGIDTRSQTFVVEDDGRGIPVEKHPKTGESTLITVFTNLQAGGKFNKQSYAVSAGLHGVGLKATNALSEWLRVTVWRKGKAYSVDFGRGTPASSKPSPQKELNKRGKSGTRIEFKPDTKIFGKSVISVADVTQWLSETSHLCPGLKINLSVDGVEKIFTSKGLSSMVEERAGELPPLSDVVEFSSEDKSITAAFLWADNDSAGDNWFSACNASSTREGGTHVDGALKAIDAVLRPYSKSKKLDKKDLVDGLCASIHVLVSEPQFKSQTKEKLLNSDVRDSVYEFLYPRLKAHFDANKKLAESLVSRALQLRKARESYKKLRAAANKAAPKKKTARGILPDKLVESMHCSPQDRELFVVEGDLAGGSAKSARDADYQEILPLRGKIPNAAQWTLAKLLGNEEISSLLIALGVHIDPKTKKADLSSMRVGRLLLLMDADPDGQHIVSLVLTFIVRWIPELIENGHVYVVDSPLFVGTHKDSRFYAHSIDDLISQSGLSRDKLSVSRLKGHGEASAPELRHYAMDPSTRKLWKISLTERDPEFIMSLMGSDSSSRKELLGLR